MDTKEEENDWFVVSETTREKSQFLELETDEFPIAPRVGRSGTSLPPLPYIYFICILYYKLYIYLLFIFK